MTRRLVTLVALLTFLAMVANACTTRDVRRGPRGDDDDSGDDDDDDGAPPGTYSGAVEGQIILGPDTLLCFGDGVLDVDSSGRATGSLSCNEDTQGILCSFPVTAHDVHQGVPSSTEIDCYPPVPGTVGVDWDGSGLDLWFELIDKESELAFDITAQLYLD